MHILKLFLFTFLLFISSRSFCITPPSLSESYLIGQGISDITGPSAGVGMMGYSMLNQKTTGIQMRLWARAFVFSSPKTNKKVTFVLCDLGMIFQAVKREVVKRLKVKYGEIYNDDNVMLTATHTHSGPGGFSEYWVYNLSIRSFNKQNFEVIVNGIVAAIEKADRNLTPASILFSEGDLFNVGMNRSPLAYDHNPSSEKEKYPNNFDTKMSLIRLQALSGKEIGLINWFPVHATSIGNKNKLISGDNKGYAEYLFEKLKGTSYFKNDQFLAAFAQSHSGDVTPNLWGYPDTVHDYKRMKIIGARQFSKALELYNSPQETLSNEVDYRHKFIDMKALACPPAIGLSTLAGSTEDGRGLKFLNEGWIFGSAHWPLPTLLRKLQKCQQQKVIVLSTSSFSPSLTPIIVPVQLFRIGSLAILATPAEFTTMAGRRLMSAVQNELREIGITHVVISALSNTYTEYVATPEEYSAQHYEGASTLFGPNSLQVYIEQFIALAVAMKNHAPVTSEVFPPDLSSFARDRFDIKKDKKPRDLNYGAVLRNSKESYGVGETVSVDFLAGNPNNNLMTGDTYLVVEKKVGDKWISVRTDNDPDTRMIWNKFRRKFHQITVEWDLSNETGPGTYRIIHKGHYKDTNKAAVFYSGISNEFVVENSSSMVSGSEATAEMEAGVRTN